MSSSIHNINSAQLTPDRAFLWIVDRHNSKDISLPLRNCALSYLLKTTSIVHIIICMNAVSAHMQEYPAALICTVVQSMHACSLIWVLLFSTCLKVFLIIQYNSHSIHTMIYMMIMKVDRKPVAIINYCCINCWLSDCRQFY